MEASHAHTLRQLLRHRPVAALATLHRDEPAVSMVPFALLPQGRGLVIHVSRLATHTADMLAQPAVALLITDDTASAKPQALPRVSLRGRAATLARDEPGHVEARAAYLAKFPDTEPLFDFADFSLVHIAVKSVRFVGGFAQAFTLMPDAYAAAMGDDG